MQVSRYYQAKRKIVFDGREMMAVKESLPAATAHPSIEKQDANHKIVSDAARNESRTVSIHIILLLCVVGCIGASVAGAYFMRKYEFHVSLKSDQEVLRRRRGGMNNPFRSSRYALENPRDEYNCEHFPEYFGISCIQKVVAHPEYFKAASFRDITFDSEYQTEEWGSSRKQRDLKEKYGPLIDNQQSLSHVVYVAHTGNEKRGYGLYARQAIKQGTPIGVYTGLLVSEKVVERGYNAEQDYAFMLPGSEDEEDEDEGEESGEEESGDRDEEGKLKHVDRMKTEQEGGDTEKEKSRLSEEAKLIVGAYVDALVMGNEMRFANDAQKEQLNLNFVFVPYRNVWHVVFEASTDVHANEELFVSYGEHYWESREIYSLDFVENTIRNRSGAQCNSNAQCNSA